MEAGLKKTYLKKNKVMRTFEQYIDEAYNFRLGGSQQKGFNQEESKTFEELEDGDVLYVYGSNWPAPRRVSALKTEKGKYGSIWLRFKMDDSRIRVELKYDTRKERYKMKPEYEGNVRYVGYTVYSTDLELMLRMLRDWDKNFTEADIEDR